MFVCGELFTLHNGTATVLYEQHTVTTKGMNFDKSAEA
jgi:hypothetical protein